MRRGYPDTMRRGLAAWSGIVEMIVRSALSVGVTEDDADRLRKALAAASADERHVALDTLLGDEDTPAGVPVPFTHPKREPANVH